MSIDLNGVSRTIGRHEILKDIKLSIKEGELLALLGPSGSGKTTLLRIIAGLETLDSGQVLLSGADATSQRPGDRGIGFVFQHYALFRHMTVFENVAFGLRVKPRKERPSEQEIQERVKELLSLVQLDWIAQRKPSELSGGQRQRVALARALAVKPRVLLLDEPFGALDARVRRELRRWLRKLHDDVKVTTVFVTHDQEEALEVADRVVVMNNGRIEQVGSPEEVYTKPATPFVLSFLGSVNLFHSRIAGGQAHVAGVTVDAPEHAQEDSAGLVFVRNHDIVVHRAQPESQVVPGTVDAIRAVGPTARLTVSVQGAPEPVEVDLSAERFAQLALKIGDTVFLELRNARIYRQEEDASATAKAPAASGGVDSRAA